MRGRPEYDKPTARMSRSDWWAVVHHHLPQESVRVLIDPDGHPLCLFT